MESTNLFLTFAEITFPILLLVPPLVTSLRRFVLQPKDLGIYFSVLVIDYLIIVASGVTASFKLTMVETNQGAVLNLAFLVTSIMLVSITIFYIIKWTLHELVYIRIEIEPRID